MRTSPALLILLMACGTTRDLADLDVADPPEVQPTVRTSATDADHLARLPDLEAAPEPSARLAVDAVLQGIPKSVDSYFASFGTRRVHVQLDRPLYRPGESVWIKTWSAKTRGLAPEMPGMVTHELVDPRGQVVQTRRFASQGTGSTNGDVVLPADAPGGRWLLRATLPTGEVDERPFVVASYEAPRIRKSLDFVREAYGAGDQVEAVVELTGPGGSALANHPVRAMLQVAGRTVKEVPLQTDSTGAVFVGLALPADLDSSDGLLTVLVEDGGITESISRSVPIVLADVQLGFFPEGGDLVEGLPGRVYFEAQNAHGEPADIQGTVQDDTGRTVATLDSVHDGMGRFAFTPAPGRTYRAHITQPPGIDETFALPAAQAEGCTLRSFDDTRSTESATRMAVRCTTAQDVAVVALFREQLMDMASVRATPGEDAVVHLDPGTLRNAQGALQVTIFNGDKQPMAERLVYRGAGQDLHIEVTPERAVYGPRDEVVLNIRTTDPTGAAVPAELALSVVDDAVIGLADDENGHMLSRMYLEPELVNSPEDPATYFDPDEPLAARGLDLVMGTRGHRRFEWAQVWNPPVPVAAATGMQLELLGYAGGDFGGMLEAEEMAFDAPMQVPDMDEPMELRGAVAAGPPKVDQVPRKAPAVMERKEERANRQAPDLEDQLALGDNRVAARDVKAKRGERAGPQEAFGQRNQMAVVRVFPKPDYREGFTGPRTDFRDTVTWEPSVVTDSLGHAQVRFYLSDALTTFRVVAEGLGGGAAGHGEQTLVSQLPVSVSTKLPAEVSAGDTLMLPLIVQNSRSSALEVSVAAVIDSPLVRADNARADMVLGASSTATHWVPLTVGTGAGQATIRLEADGGGLSDTMERELRVVPPGFPRTWSAAGELEGSATFTVQIDEVVPGSLHANVSWQPSTVSTLVQGMDGLIRTPGGCFEQTSSTNWPNVAILRHLEAHDGDPRLRLQSAQALKVGYTKLSGYQVDAGGFETWGTGPGKEVLSAFGLLQFADMAAVFPVDEAILQRDVDYLVAQMDGKGGFRNSGDSAHGYGSAPKPVLDGFIAYSLVKTGHGDLLGKVVDSQAQAAERSTDPYVLALAARVLAAVQHPGATKAQQRLADMQAADGSFPGAESSITRSYEANLLVESTALAALALMDSSAHRAAVDKAVGWLIDNRRGVGTWGATQATALALDALTTHAEHNRRPRTGGAFSVEVNGEPAGRVTYTADQEGAIEIDGWERFLETGTNTVTLRQLSGEPLPFTVDVGWTSIQPESTPGAELALSTVLSTTKAKMGDTVRLTARVGNTTGDVVPSPIARIGLPAGLDAQGWQLEELKDRGVIAFYETRPREVVLYWDGIHSDEEHEVGLDLVASVPGRFTAPASRAHPYYDDDEIAWTAGLTVNITP